MPYFRCITNSVNIDISFKDKVIFITGDSGVGKSKLVDYLVSNKLDNSIESDLDVIVLNKFTEKLYRADNNTITLMDENYAKKHSDKLKDGEGYFIVISRNTIDSINYSYRSIYVATRDEYSKVTVLKRAYDLVNNCEFEPDCIITEDSGSCYKYICALLSNTCIDIISSGSKSNLKETIKKQAIKYKKILVLCDAGGIGSEMNRLGNASRYCKTRDVQLKFIMPECFEHVLLCSDYFNYSKDIFKHYTVNYSDTEKYCEQMLESLTNETQLKYTHKPSSMSECWIKDCKLCNERCEYFRENKNESVLSGGHYAELLKLSK